MYFVVLMVGMVGDLGVLGEKFKEVGHWSPYGSVKAILSASMQPSTWNMHTNMALLVTILYAVIFAVTGIKKFKWSTQ